VTQKEREELARMKIHQNKVELGITGVKGVVVKMFEDYEICHKTDFTPYQYKCVKKLISMGIVEKDEDEGFFDLSSKGYRLFKQPMRDALRKS